MIVPGSGGLSFLIIAAMSSSFMSAIVERGSLEFVPLMTSSARMDERSDVTDACCCVEWWTGANDSAAVHKSVVARALLTMELFFILICDMLFDMDALFVYSNVGETVYVLKANLI
eukprot:scaffold10476_cov107-Skeletonema_dohrnii-CCMP3373.AAC.1